jgi:hypothetical protein
MATAADPLLDDLFAAVDAGDSERVLAQLADASQAKRKRLAPKLRAKHEALRQRAAFWADLGWTHDAIPHRTTFGDDPTQPSAQRVAAVTACAATCTAAAFRRLLAFDGDPFAVDPDLAGRAIAARGPAFAAAVVEKLLEPEAQTAAEILTNRWSLARWLVRSGAAPKPNDPRYTLMLVTSVAPFGDWRDPDGVYRALVADPGLLEEEVWQIFEVDVVNELDQQSVWESRDEPSAVVPVPGDNRWRRALVRLAAEGAIDRARLLDASLSALGQDFRPSRIGWHGELHEALGPTHDERMVRMEAYAGLLSSHVPSVVRAGMTGLEAIADEVPSSVLTRAAPGPLSMREKKYAVQMLRLLEKALARDPSAADGLLTAIAHGLEHQRPDVQARALDLLERHAALIAEASGARGVVLAASESVAPTLQPRVAALAGTVPLEPVAESVSEWPATRQVAIDAAAVRMACATVEPRGNLNALVETAAVVLEGDASAEEVELLLDGVSRLCSGRDANVRRRASALLKRADQVLRSGYGHGVSSAEIAALLLRAWLERDRRLAGYEERRLARIGALVRRGKARSLEALPTHVGGWVDPAVLEERQHRRSDPSELAVAHQRQPRTSDAVLTPRIDFYMDGRNATRVGRPDLLSLLMRKPQPPAGSAAFFEWAAATGRRITDEDLRAVGVQDVEAARREAGDPVLVLEPADGDTDPAAAFLRMLYSDTRTRGWKREVLWARDRGAARWLMSLHPARPDVFFALVATNASVFADDNVVYGHGDVVLQRAFDPLVDLRGAGWFAIGASLLVRAHDMRRVATDVVIATVEDGRFDPQALAEALGWLLSDGVGNLRRVSQALADAARVSDLHARQVWRLIVALVPYLPADIHGLHEPLELALQLGTAHGLRPDHAQAKALGDHAVGKSKTAAAARAMVAAAG